MDDAPTIFAGRTGVKDAAIRNIEIDGNESNNRGATRQNAQQNGIGIEEPDETQDRPERIKIENVYIHDVIRNPIVLSGRDCTVQGAGLSNSQIDHLLYMARAVGCGVKNVWMSWMADSSMLVLGVADIGATDNDIQNVHFSNPVSTPSGDHPNNAIRFRPSSAYEDNTARGIYMEYESGETGQRIIIDHQATIEGVRYDGPFDIDLASPVIDIDASNGHRIYDCDFNITDTTETDLIGIAVKRDDMKVRDVSFAEPNTTGMRTAVYANATHGDLTDVLVDSVAAPSHAYDAQANGQTNVADIDIRGIHDPSRVDKNNTSNTFWADGVTILQRLSDMSSFSSILWEGRFAVSDGGSSDSTAGPAYWDDSQWVSLVDGATWT